MKNKNGISLIVLVITIVVMIVLSATIILSLNNTDVLDDSQLAVNESNLDEVQHLATMKWAEAFADGETTQSQLQSAVLEGLYKKNIDISKYNIQVTTEGVTVTSKDITDSVNWVVQTVDGVPIPKGFIASSATGESTKSGGLVIYEGTDSVTDENVETARRTRNQYVWIPVVTSNFKTDFVRRDFAGTSNKVNTLGTMDKFWEVVLDENNMPLASQDTKYMTYTTIREVQQMYASVKKYGGFYIARYETGIDVQRKSDNGILETKLYSVMGKIPYTYIPWTNTDNPGRDIDGAVQLARSMYSAIDTSSNYGVVSTLPYGVQWDAVLNWWLETGAVDSVTDSTSYGNHNNHVISSPDELNDGALVWDFSSDEEGSYVSKTSSTLTYPKASETYWALSTGALKAANINNIYDMKGNMWEWTMEGYSTNYRSYRGGSFHSDGSTSLYPVYMSQSQSGSSVRKGFRAALYIKI